MVCGTINFYYVAVVLFRRLFDNSCRSSETSVQMSLTDIFASKAFVAFVDKIPEDVAGGLACFAGGALAGGALGLAVSTVTATTSVAARGGGGACPKSLWKINVIMTLTFTPSPRPPLLTSQHFSIDSTLKLILFHL